RDRRDRRTALEPSRLALGRDDLLEHLLHALHDVLQQSGRLHQRRLWLASLLDRPAGRGARQPALVLLPDPGATVRVSADRDWIGWHRLLGTASAKPLR